ncbi:MAG: hypothetical protein Q4G48_10045 [Bacteroidia bacterium]|nr:hypothetical protein [Bacteroidia bacterium]
MNNDRIEIVVISMLLFSFIFFLISYSNYDMRRKRGLTGGGFSYVHNGKKAMERNGNEAVDVNSFWGHVFKRAAYQQITNESGMRMPENNLIKSERKDKKIYSQLLFHDSFFDCYSDTRYRKFT